MGEEYNELEILKGNESTKSKVDLLSDKLENERNDYSLFIRTNILDKLNDIANIGTLQVHLSSQRQRLVDKSAYYKFTIKKKNQNQGKLYKQKYLYYKTSHDVHLNDY